MPSTAELTEKYLNEHPSIKDSLKKGVINYSRLARLIARDLGIEKQTSMEAVLIACRRYAARLKKNIPLEDTIRGIFGKSELEIKNKIVVIIVEKKLYIDNLLKIEKKIRSAADTFYAIEGTNSYVIIVSEKYTSEVEELFRVAIKRVTKNLALITIKSPEAIETTPGIIAYLFSLLAERGINVGEIMSCWTDTMFVVEEKDIALVMQVLRF